LKDLIILIREFLTHCGPKSQQFEEMVQDLEDAFQERMFPLDPIEYLREISFEEHIYKEEYPDEFSHAQTPDKTFDQNKVFIPALPLNEDIQASIPPSHQEENMMSCEPFEDLDDTLFHDLGREEALEETLDIFICYR
jgi:hypothetical protein